MDRLTTSPGVVLVGGARLEANWSRSSFSSGTSRFRLGNDIRLQTAMGCLFLGGTRSWSGQNTVTALMIRSLLLIFGIGSSLLDSTFLAVGQHTQEKRLHSVYKPMTSRDFVFASLICFTYDGNAAVPCQRMEYSAWRQTAH